MWGLRTENEFSIFQPKNARFRALGFQCFLPGGRLGKDCTRHGADMKNVPRTFKECGAQVYDDIILYNSCVTGLRNCMLRP